jgi:hypothetical protein
MSNATKPPGRNAAAIAIRARSIAAASGRKFQHVGSEVLAGELEHRRRGVGRDHAMAGINQSSRQQSGSAADFDNEAVADQYRLEQREQSRGACRRVKPEAAMVHEREIATVIRISPGQPPG